MKAFLSIQDAYYVRWCFGVDAAIQHGRSYTGSGRPTLARQEASRIIQETEASMLMSSLQDAPIWTDGKMRRSVQSALAVALSNFVNS